MRALLVDDQIDLLLSARLWSSRRFSYSAAAAAAGGGVGLNQEAQQAAQAVQEAQHDAAASCGGKLLRAQRSCWRRPNNRNPEKKQDAVNTEHKSSNQTKHYTPNLDPVRCVMMTNYDTCTHTQNTHRTTVCCWLCAASSREPIPPSTTVPPPALGVPPCVSRVCACALCVAAVCAVGGLLHCLRPKCGVN